MELEITRDVLLTVSCGFLLGAIYIIGEAAKGLFAERKEAREHARWYMVFKRRQGEVVE
ncbi:hypothetical protein [Schlesneria sp. DSM 10557]|uniref:hypothetical protein n=1 Tax=Schlesneria sp. DSM 10557 TaxID=3044399 RepID=UPI0035A0ED31